MLERRVLVEELFVTGVNFHKSDIDFRSKFSLDGAAQSEYLNRAKEHGFQVQVILSTCNRCEIYGVGNKTIAEKILCEITGQSFETYQQFKFTKDAYEALEHIFRVASGLDSQIVGDIEILGQFRNACKLSKKLNMLGSLFERIANTAIQAAKEVRSNTELSKGTSSVSYAAVDLIKKKYPNYNLKTLVIGTGKFGHAVVKNFMTYFPAMQLTVANRTNEVAQEMAKNAGIGHLQFSEIASQSKNFDIVVLCANANDYIIKPEYLEGVSNKLLLDLSVPRAADPVIREMEQLEFYNVDDISEQLNQNIENRKQFLPLAEAIIADNLAEFMEWYKIYVHNKKIKKTKEILLGISHQCPHLASMEHSKLDKTINTALNKMVLQLKAGNQSACEVLQTVNHFLESNHQPSEANH
jgi:glutamyl-tRNA reductase